MIELRTTNRIWVRLFLGAALKENQKEPTNFWGFSYFETNPHGCLCLFCSFHVLKDDEKEHHDWDPRKNVKRRQIIKLEEEPACFMSPLPGRRPFLWMASCGKLPDSPDRSDRFERSERSIRATFGLLVPLVHVQVPLGERFLSAGLFVGDAPLRFQPGKARPTEPDVSGSWFGPFSCKMDLMGFFCFV